MAKADDRLGVLFLEAISKVLSDAVEPDQVLKLLLDQAVVQCGADRGAFIKVEQGGTFSYRVMHRFHARHAAGIAGEYSRSLFKHVLKTGSSVLVDNALKDVRFMHRESIQNLRIVSIICQPQMVDGTICGILYLESTTPGHFTEQHQQLLEELTVFSSQALSALQAGRTLLAERNHLRAHQSESRQEVRDSRVRLSEEWNFNRFVGRSEVVRQLEVAVARAAASDYPLLLTGETGTGKNLLARVIHHGGSRRHGKFVHLFCPSLERGMVESTLFGHRTGAFTGALEERIGKIQAAEKGSLFLDEISTLPMDIQPKLLRLLEDRTYEKVGDHKEQRINLRFLASSNQDLDALVCSGSFRQDLYQRLNFLSIRLPSLRERREDIPLLIRHFLDRGSAAVGGSTRWIHLSEEAKKYLVNFDYGWPGNVRQIQQLAARLAVEEEAGEVSVSVIQRMLDKIVNQTSGPVPQVSVKPPVAVVTPVPAEAPAPVVLPLPGEKLLEALLAEAERKILMQTLRAHPEKPRSRQAEILGISESKLYKLLSKYGLS